MMLCSETTQNDATKKFLSNAQVNLNFKMALKFLYDNLSLLKFLQDFRLLMPRRSPCTECDKP